MWEVGGRVAGPWMVYLVRHLDPMVKAGPLPLQGPLTSYWPGPGVGSLQQLSSESLSGPMFALGFCVLEAQSEISHD